MITLLLGSDNLAKKQYIKQIATQSGAEIQTFGDSGAIPILSEIFVQQLFGPSQLLVFDHVWQALDPEQLLDNVVSGKTPDVFIVEDSLDQRKKVNKEFQKNDLVKVVQFDAPVGINATSEWITKYALQQNTPIQPPASVVLARALLIDEDSSLDVLRFQNEFEKLKQYANGQPISADIVAELVTPVAGINIFDLLNAIATKNKNQALSLLEDFFNLEATDDKQSAIKITALLADQFRSLLIALDAISRRMADAEVLKLTNWKSGRLFMMKKFARSFNISQVKQALVKLENLDRELKTGSLPSHVVLDLIIAGL